MTGTIESDHIHDLIGIGIGPFNLGMAALLEDVPEIDALFFEKKQEFNWHPGMLINGTTLQVPFLADLVSMANVRSKYSFLNYLQYHNRMYHFYFLEKFHIPRKEYNHYCRWVAEQLPTCQFGNSVDKIYKVEVDGQQVYELQVYNEKTRTTKIHYAKHLVIGIGTTPSVPFHMKKHLGETVFHSSQYLKHKSRCLNATSISVIGSGQSAAEVFYDLAQEQESNAYSINWYTRSKGFFPMEYSKLGLEHFSPDFIDFFYKLPQRKKDQILVEQDLLYKGISEKTIANIYDHLYERSIGNAKPAIGLKAMTEITDIKKGTYKWKLEGVHRLTEASFTEESEVVILGTGYKPAKPNFLAEIHNCIDWDKHGRYQINHDYQLKMKDPFPNTIFIQNGELHTHGVGAPDLGLGAHRNAVIINYLAEREVYRVHSKNVFQTFGTETSCMPVNV